MFLRLDRWTSVTPTGTPVSCGHLDYSTKRDAAAGAPGWADRVYAKVMATVGDPPPGFRRTALDVAENLYARVLTVTWTDERESLNAPPDGEPDAPAIVEAK